jgi:hypothetical protein
MWTKFDSFRQSISGLCGHLYFRAPFPPAYYILLSGQNYPFYVQDYKQNIK